MCTLQQKQKATNNTEYIKSTNLPLQRQIKKQKKAKYKTNTFDITIGYIFLHSKLFQGVILFGSLGNSEVFLMLSRSRNS